MHDLFVLLKYFLYQDTIRLQFEKYLLNKELKDSKAYINIYMDLWYWTLYVLIEWWYELRLKDEKITKLLRWKNKELLREYRNGVFHFQKDWYDKKFENFHAEESTVLWSIELHKEFWRFFNDKIKTWELVAPPLPKQE